MNFLFAEELSSDFFLIYKLSTNYTQICFLSIAFARPGTSLPVVREITCVRKIKTCIILESNQECAKFLLDFRTIPTMLYFFVFVIC